MYIKIWNIQSVIEYEEHEKRAWSVDFSSTEPSMLVSGGDDCKVKTVKHLIKFYLLFYAACNRFLSIYKAQLNLLLSLKYNHPLEIFLLAISKLIIIILFCRVLNANSFTQLLFGFLLA